MGTLCQSVDVPLRRSALDRGLHTAATSFALSVRPRRRRVSLDVLVQGAPPFYHYD
jgi:hypothetical protein